MMLGDCTSGFFIFGNINVKYTLESLGRLCWQTHSSGVVSFIRFLGLFANESIVKHDTFLVWHSSVTPYAFLDL
jgi:hypothetical protein